MIKSLDEYRGIPVWIFIPESPDFPTLSDFDKAVIHCHGDDKKHPNDVINQGLPALANDGFEFPFPIIAPYSDNNSWWTFNERFMPNHFERYPNMLIHLDGISGGGINIWKMIKKKYWPHVKSFSICCGAGDKFDSVMPNTPNCGVWHGEDDKKVGYSWGSTTFESYVKYGGGRGSFNGLEGKSHSIWNEVYQGGLWESWARANTYLFVDNPQVEPDPGPQKVDPYSYNKAIDDAILELQKMKIAP